MPGFALQSENCRFAGLSDLPRVGAVWSTANGLLGVPKNAQSWIAYLVAWIKLGYRGLAVPISALTTAHRLACAGANGSDSSTHRALRWLEDNGFVRRHTFRVGPDRLRTKIEFIVSRFEFFLYPTERTVSHISHNSTPLSDCVCDDLSNNPSTLESDSLKHNASNANSKRRANASETKRRHHVVYTILVVLRRTNATDRSAIIRRAESELSGQVQQSFDWTYWSTDRWWSMSRVERETLAERELIPLLRAQLTPPSTTETVPTIDMIVGLLTGQLTVPGKIAPEEKEIVYLPKKVEYVQTSCDPKELEIILELDRKLKEKRKALGL